MCGIAESRGCQLSKRLWDGINMNCTETKRGCCTWRTWKHSCALYSQTKMKRRAVGIWHCGSCRKTVAGGAWTYKYVVSLSWLFARLNSSVICWNLAGTPDSFRWLLKGSFWVYWRQEWKGTINFFLLIKKRMHLNFKALTISHMFVHIPHMKGAKLLFTCHPQFWLHAQKARRAWNLAGWTCVM